jgi:hypothetical protein
MFNNYAKSELELMVGSNEEILWKGKPNKRCFILEGIFNPMLPFALVWFLFDSMFIAAFLGGKTISETPTAFTIIQIIFFLFHLEYVISPQMCCILLPVCRELPLLRSWIDCRQQTLSHNT